MAVLILIICLLLTEESVLSDVQCGMKCTETLINHYIRIEEFDRKQENRRISSYLKQISTRIGLINTDSVKDIGNIQQIANSFETDNDDIDQIKNITAEFITAIDKIINNQARTFSQDHELFEQRISQQFSDFNKSFEISQRKNNQQIANSVKTVEDDIEQIKNITAGFKRATDERINDLTRKWAQDFGLFEQNISQKISDFSKSLEMTQQENVQQMANSREAVKNGIKHIEEFATEFKTATDKIINNQTRQWAQDHELFEQRILEKFSDLNKSMEFNQQEHIQYIAKRFETVKDDMEQTKNITAEFQTATNKEINKQGKKWSQDHELFEQSILQKFSYFSKSLEIKHQKSDQQMANSFESVKNDMKQLEKNIAQKEDDIKDHVIVDLGQAKKEIQTDLDKCIESAKDAKSSVVEFLNTVAALKSDYKDIETSVKGSTDTVSDLKDKFEKHVDDSTKRFHSVAKKFGTCRSIKGNETNWKENWKLHESKCFRFFGKRKKWLDAVESCKEHNADLVQIESKEENDFIMAYANLTQRVLWIGLNDRETESVWEWQSTENTLPSGHFSYWAKGQPNDRRKNEDCVIMHVNGQWNDFPCGATARFVCQKDPEL